MRSPIVAGLRRSLGAAGIILMAGCYSTQTVTVTSEPRGAAILIENEDCGQKTPAEITLSNSEDAYTLTIVKPGYNPVTRVVAWQTDVDPIKPKEAAGAILCAPCCLGLPLLRFLEPVKVTSGFVPRELDARLDPEGQGLRLTLAPRESEVYVDGVLRRPMEADVYQLESGDHQLEVRCDGYRALVRRVRIREHIYESLDVSLPIGGQGCLIHARPAGAELSVDGAFRKRLDPGEHRVRMEPGEHEIRVELDGYRVWRNIVKVEPEIYHPIDVELRLSGQGLIVHKPSGTRSRDREIRITVNSELHEASFEKPIRLPPGSYEIIVEVQGYWPWRRVVRIHQETYLEIEPDLKRE